MARRRAVECGVVLLAVVAATVPMPAATVERVFSTGLYPRLQRVVTPLTNLLPFALFDLILLVVIAGGVTWLVAGVRRARRERRWQPLIGAGWRLTVVAAAGYLTFLALWGLNYRRVPMSERVVMREESPARPDVMALGMTAVARMNELHQAAHAGGWPHDEWRDPGLVTAFESARRLLADSPATVPGRLKWTLLAPYFRWTGVDGMVDPFALEVLANSDLLPWERPFVAAHEWAHLAGFADESEASFVAWLACVRGSAAAQYSGWLSVYWQVSGELGREDGETLMRTLGDGPRRDVAAIVERLRRGQLPFLRTASWAMYDQYLRANRVDAGVQSYGEVITLILRTRLDEGYRPIRRDVVTPSP